MIAEYIERDKVLSYAYCPTQLTVDNPLAEDKSVVDVQDIESIPTADVAEVKHGEWENNGGFYRCSECINYTGYDYDYCPYCGAKMDE